jgi:hypothetical protein
MNRTRLIPAAPVRSASASWSLLEEIVMGTLASSSAVSDDDVQAGLAAAAGVGRLLIAAGHLDEHPIVLVAAPVHLSIYTISGNKALGAEEPTAVAGGASATEWTLYLPSPSPLTDAVMAAVTSHPNLSSADPPTEAAAPAAASIDRAALARRIGEKR